MLVVTTNEIYGWDLQRVCGEVFGVSVRAANDSSNPADARAAAVARMLDHARVKGGNAVVGLRLDSTSTGDGRVEICAYATAVVAAPVDEAARQTATSLGYGQPAASAEEPPAPQAGEPQPYEQHQPYEQQQQQYGQQPGYPPQGYPQPGYPPQGYPQQYPGQPYPGQSYPQGYPGPQ